MNLLGKHQYWTRRQALRLLAGAAGGLALHACTKTAETPSAETMSASMGINTWIGFTPLFIAQEKGFFKQLGLNLDVKLFGSVTDAGTAFVAGRLDGLGTVTSESVAMAARGKDYRVVLVEDNSVGGDGILARNSIADIKAFKGKKIAVERGGMSHFFLLQVLQEAGLSEKDITIVSVAPDAAAAAYQAGNVEIAVTYAPFLQKANQAQKDGRIIYDTSKMPNAITDLYIFDTKFTQTNPKAVEAFVEGIFKGLAFLNQNPTEGLAIAAKRLGVTPESLAADLKGIKLPDASTNIEMLGNPQSDLYMLKSMNTLAEFLETQKQIEKVPDLAKVLEPTFVKTVQAKL
jgi:NitT/TauT family transport system substrate-binding protein